MRRRAHLLPATLLLTACREPPVEVRTCPMGCIYTCGGGVDPPFFTAGVEGDGSAWVRHAGRDRTLRYSKRVVAADVYRADGWTLHLLPDRASLRGPGVDLRQCGGVSLEE